MESFKYGRKFISFDKGATELTGISVTEKPVPGEDESAFTTRLLAKYGNKQGTLEIVIKNGFPSYAIITVL